MDNPMKRFWLLIIFLVVGFAVVAARSATACPM
jgi:hypothetical protein